jgi:putative ABC transport system permease protein
MRVASAVFALMLYAFPRAIRRAHRGEMLALFEQTLSDARGRGPGAVVATALRQYGEVLAAGLTDRAGTFVRDLRYAARTLARLPGFTFVVIVTFALGIGATATVAAVVVGVLVRPLPYAHPERLVVLSQTLSLRGHVMCSHCVFGQRDLDAWKRAARTLESIGESTWATRVLGGANPVQLSGKTVDQDYFATLGMRPLLGRSIVADDRRPGAAPVALISAALWHSRFASDPRMVGSRIRLDGRLTSIVGVASADFLDPDRRALRGDGASFWLPLSLPPSGASDLQRAVFAVARVRHGIPSSAVTAEISLLSERAAHLSGNLLTGTVLVEPLRESLLGDVRPTLLLATLAVLAVLVIACANVSSLLLARGAARRREIAIRFALGAGRSRIVAQLLTETVALAAAGAALGVALAALALRGVIALRPYDLPRIDTARLDPAVLAGVVAATVVAAVAAGLVPALDLARPDLDDALKGGERGGSDRRGDRMREGFVVAQIALALAVVVFGGLVARSAAAYARLELGFTPAGVYVAQGRSRPEIAPAVRAARVARLRAAVAALPGIEDVTVSGTTPLGDVMTGTLSVPGHAASSPMGDVVRLDTIDAAYFRTLRIPLRSGRTVDERASGEAVVSAEFARTYFPRGNALGARFYDGTLRDAANTHTIVGIAADVPTDSVTARPLPFAYLGRDAGSFPFFDLTVRSSLPAASVRRELESAWTALGPDQLPLSVQPMDDIVAKESAGVRTVGVLLAALGALALALATTGLYGLIAFSVARRTREIGIRIALGSSRARVLRIVVARGVRLALAGVVLGVAVALASSRSVEPFLYGVSAVDPLTYACVAGALALVALIASYVPARRATKIDPMRALRYE